jgi:hypothetical protein
MDVPDPQVRYRSPHEVEHQARRPLAPANSKKARTETYCNGRPTVSWFPLNLRGIAAHLADTGKDRYRREQDGNAR